MQSHNPVKLEPKLIAKTKKETKRLEVETQELTKVKTKYSRFLEFQIFNFSFHFCKIYF